MVYGDWTAQAGRAAALGFLDLAERPSAIFTANRLMMTGVLQALQQRRPRCPQDIEVMSSDDSDWLDVFEPRISTVAQPSYEMGAQSAQLVLKRIKAPNRRFERIVLEPKLMIRKRAPTALSELVYVSNAPPRGRRGTAMHN